MLILQITFMEIVSKFKDIFRVTLLILKIESCGIHVIALLLIKRRCNCQFFHCIFGFGSYKLILEVCILRRPASYIRNAITFQKFNRCLLCELSGQAQCRRQCFLKAEFLKIRLNLFFLIAHCIYLFIIASVLPRASQKLIDISKLSQKINFL